MTLRHAQRAGSLGLGDRDASVWVKVAWSKSGYAELKPLKDFLMMRNDSYLGGRRLKEGMGRRLVVEVRLQEDIGI